MYMPGIPARMCWFTLRPDPPFGPGFTADQIADADTLEVWVTTLADIADTTVWRLLRAGQPVAMAEVGGL